MPHVFGEPAMLKKIIHSCPYTLFLGLCYLMITVSIELESPTLCVFFMLIVAVSIVAIVIDKIKNN